MRCGVADAIDAGDRGHVVQQLGEIDAIAAVRLAAVGVDVLAQQIHFANAAPGESGHFADHVIQGPRHFLTAGVGHHAETTVLAATLHNRHEGARSLDAGFGKAVEFLDFGEADVDDNGAALAPCIEHLRQAVQGLRAEHEVHIRRALADGGAFLTGYAATDADNEFGFFAF